MPYLSINTTVELTGAQKESLKAELGRLIPIIPGKTEQSLMIDLAGGRVMYMGGKAAPCAYIDFRLYTKVDDGAKKRFTQETLAFLSRELNIAIENLYMTVAEFDQWGYDGQLH